MTDLVAEEWRGRFLSTVEQIDDDPEPVVLQSGGLDSLTITAALCALGRRPRLVTFTVGGSDYPDVVRVRQVADRFNLELLVVDIERNERQLVADVRLAVAARAVNKTHVQCYQPVSHMGAAILDRYGAATVWMGTGGIVEDIRKVVVTWAQQGEEAAREIRRKCLVAGGSPNTGANFMHRALIEHGHVVAEPYAHPSFASYSLSLDMAVINSPRQKGIAVRAFRDFYDQAGVMPPKNNSLQVGSGIRGWHDTLLASPKYNPDGFKAIVAVYRRINDVPE